MPVPTIDGEKQDRFVLAALELFEERGYEGTTVTAIAQRAGLARRTFFRYFTDKREVLFTQTVALEELWTSTVSAAPPGCDPLAVIQDALRATAELLEPRRAGSVRRHVVLSVTPELREREQMKLTRLAELTAARLEAHSVPRSTAHAAAALGVLVLRLAYEQWAAAPEGRPLQAEMFDVLADVRKLATAAPTSDHTT